jgi:hypothetical protein
MNVFNPKILDASIRDAALCLSDNQKADLLLHALGGLPQDGFIHSSEFRHFSLNFIYYRPSRAVFENAIQSCLQVSTLSPHNAARARILRARRRLSAGYQRGAQEGAQCLPYHCRDFSRVDRTDLQAALIAEPDNPEAKALLHRRSVAVEKVHPALRS